MWASPGPVSPWLPALVKSQMSAPSRSTVVITPTFFKVSVMIKPVDTYHLVCDKQQNMQTRGEHLREACSHTNGFASPDVT